MTDEIRKFYIIAMIGYIGVILLLILLIGWWHPPLETPKSLALLIFVGPLMMLLRGMLNARYNSHLWANLVALIYICGAFILAITELTRIPGILLLVFATLWFFGSFKWMRGMIKIKKAAEAAAENSNPAP